MKHCYEGRRDCQTDQQKKLEQIDKCKEGQENKNHGNCQGSDEEFEVMID